MYEWLFLSQAQRHRPPEGRVQQGQLRAAPPRLAPGDGGSCRPGGFKGRACPSPFSPRCSLERARQPQRPDGCDPRWSPVGLRSPQGEVRPHPRACGPRVRTAGSQRDLGGEKSGERREWQILRSNGKT